MKKITIMGMLLTSLLTFAQAPSNDDCEGAITLTVNENQLCGTVTSGTTLGGTASPQEDDVSGTPANDVWYNFVATAAEHRISLTNIVDLGGDEDDDMGLGVYSGDCSALVFVDTSDPESFNVSGLTPGETYYVRVYGWYEDSPAMTFDICIGTAVVSDPPANDECEGAIDLTVNADLLCGTVTSGTTLGGTASPQDDDVSGTPNNDVWYTFVATQSTHRVSLSNIINLDGNDDEDMGLGVYSGDCAALTLVGTSDPETFTVNGLTSGETYYVRAYGWYEDSSPMTFDICIGTPVVVDPPANDECEDAIVLTAGPDACMSPTAGTTQSATASAQSSTGVSGTPNNDVWYSFVATAVDHTVTLSNVVNLNDGFSTDMGMAIYSGNCGGLTLVNTSDPDIMEVTGLTVGDTYYLRVYGWNASSDPMSFDICVSSQAPAPDNDDCSTAVEATLPFTVTQNASGATNAGFVGCDGDMMNDGVWYSFEGDGGEINITVSPFGWDPEVGIYSGDCSNLVCVGSVDDGATGTEETFTIDASQVGVTYYVNIGHYNGSADEAEGAFTMDITSTLSVPGFDSANFKAYPNPVKEVLNLDYINDISSVAVFNLLGQQVLSRDINSSSAQLDMSSLGAGSYLVKVTADNQVKTIKVIKQ